MKFTKLSLLGAVSAVALTFAAGTNLALADGHAVKPVKMRWASDHSGPPHPAAIARLVPAVNVRATAPTAPKSDNLVNFSKISSKYLESQTIT